MPIGSACARSVGLALLGVALLAPSAPARAQDEAPDEAPAKDQTCTVRYGGASRNRWARTSTSVLRLRTGPEGSRSIIEVRRTVETIVTVNEADGRGQLRVFEADTRRARTLAGEVEWIDEAGLKTTDPIEGTILKFQVGRQGYTGTRIRGPTSRLLDSHLATPHGSGLREQLVPSGEWKVGDEREILDIRAARAIADLVPSLARPTPPIRVGLRAIAAGADGRVASFAGTAMVRVDQRVPALGFGHALDVEARFALEFDLERGYLRRIEVRGSREKQVLRGETPESLTVEFEMTETIRPVPVTSDGETLQPVFDGRSWKLGHAKKGAGGQTIAEYVIEGETVEDWTELVTVHTYRLGPGSSLATFYDTLRKLHMLVEPKTVWSVLEQGKRDMRYEWRLAGSDSAADQHELGRLVMGEKRLLHIRYTKKTEKLRDEARKQWLDRLGDAQTTSE